MLNQYITPIFRYIASARTSFSYNTLNADPRRVSAIAHEIAYTDPTSDKIDELLTQLRHNIFRCANYLKRPGEATRLIAQEIALAKSRKQNPITNSASLDILIEDLSQFASRQNAIRRLIRTR